MKAPLIVAICVVSVLGITISQSGITLPNLFQSPSAKYLVTYEKNIDLEAEVKELKKINEELEQAFFQKDSQLKQQNLTVKKLLEEVLPLVPANANQILNGILKKYGVGYELTAEKKNEK